MDLQAVSGLEKKKEDASLVNYKYRAQDENGKVVSGTMQATDELDLHARLKQ